MLWLYNLLGGKSKYNNNSELAYIFVASRILHK
jgi:hypothetical protein